MGPPFDPGPNWNETPRSATAPFFFCQMLRECDGCVGAPATHRPRPPRPPLACRSDVITFARRASGYVIINFFKAHKLKKAEIVCQSLHGDGHVALPVDPDALAQLNNAMRRSCVKGEYCIGMYSASGCNFTSLSARCVPLVFRLIRPYT